MKSSKIYHLLSHLPQSERAEFKKFLQSPTFNRKPEFTVMLDRMEKHLLRKADQDLSEAEFWELCFPHMAFKLKKFRNLKSEMAGLFREFIAFRQYQRQPGLQSSLMLQGLEHHHLDEEFTQQFAKTAKAMRARKPHNADWFWDQYQLQSLRSGFAARQSSDSNFEPLKSMLGNLDAFFLPARLRIVTALLDVNEMRGEMRSQMIEETKAMLGQAGQPFPVLTRIYRGVFQFQIEPDREEQYWELKELLAESREVLSREEMRDLYTHLLNYVLRKANRGNERYRKEAGLLYRAMLDLGILLENGRITAENFRNIVTVMSALDQLEWVATFIEEFHLRIGGDYKDNALNYSRAILAFFQESYSESRRLIDEVLQDHENVFYKFAGRRRLLMIWYEQEKYDLFQSGYDAFRMFLTRNKEKYPWFEEGARNFSFSTLLKDLVRVRTSLPEKRPDMLAELESRVLEADNLPGRRWLLVKISESISA